MFSEEFQVAGLVVLTIILFPFFIRYLAGKNKFFTFPTSQVIKTIEKGGVMDKQGIWRGGVFIGRVVEPGYVALRKYRVKAEEDLTSADYPYIEKISSLNKILRKFPGVHFYGIYPFYHIKTFPMKRSYDNPEGKGPADWIYHKDTVIVDGLRRNFPRPFSFTDVELGDNSKVHLKIVIKLHVVDSYIPLYQFTDDFFTQTASILKSEVIDKLKEFLTMNDFRNSPKGEIAGFLREYRDRKANGDESDLNQELIKQVGLCIVGIAISDWEPGNKKLEDAFEQLAVEEAEGNARIKKEQKNIEVAKQQGDAYKEKWERQTAADVARMNKLAESRGKYIEQTKASLALPGADQTVVARAAADIIEAEALAGPDSKITTLFQRGVEKPSVAIPIKKDGEK